MDQVRLPDLEVIRKYSIAVRAEHAPVEEVVEALRADLAKLTAGKAPAARGASKAKAPARKGPRR